MEGDDGKETKFQVLRKEKVEFGTFYKKDENGEFVRTKGNKLDASPEIWFTDDEKKSIVELLKKG